MALVFNLYLVPSAFRKAALMAAALLFASPAFPQAQPPASANIPTYFEFGTVVFKGQHNIDIQTVDPKTEHSARITFTLGAASRVDPVQVNDTVEVIYAPNGTEKLIRRLVLLTTGIPSEGPPPGEVRAIPKPIAVSTGLSSVAYAGQPATAAPINHTGARTAGGSSATPSSVAVASAKTSGAKTPSATTAVVRGAATPGAKAPTASAAAIDQGAPAKVKTTVHSATLGPGDASLPKAIVAREVTREKPAEECNRSSEDWPTQPLRLAVLDFRYPTEREEAHDHGNTGGGSGTAVADLVYDRLDALNEFGMIRGDRTKLYKADFAGAARVGREIGADAVLAGTFVPVDPPPGSDPEAPQVKSYELRAGIVDTCTGQLLLRLVSVQCPSGIDPNASLNEASCTRRSVTAKQASNPKEQVSAFKVPIDVMLDPLVHDGPPPGTEGSAGVVTVATDQAKIVIKVASGAKLKIGDQVAIHAWRLTKNPTTYTLHNLHDEEIGRLTLTAIDGGSATGTYVGDFPPKPGDTAELVPDLPAAAATSTVPTPVGP